MIPFNFEIRKVKHSIHLGKGTLFVDDVEVCDVVSAEVEIYEPDFSIQVAANEKETYST